MSLVAAVFADVVKAINNSLYHKGGINFLYYNRGNFACGKGSKIPKDAIKIIVLHQLDFDKGLKSEKWSEIHRKLNQMIEGEVIKCQQSPS